MVELDQTSGVSVPNFKAVKCKIIVNHNDIYTNIQKIFILVLTESLFYESNNMSEKVKEQYQDNKG